MICLLEFMMCKVKDLSSIHEIQTYISKVCVVIRMITYMFCTTELFCEQSTFRILFLVYFLSQSTKRACTSSSLRAEAQTVHDPPHSASFLQQLMLQFNTQVLCTQNGKHNHYIRILSMLVYMYYLLSITQLVYLSLESNGVILNYESMIITGTCNNLEQTKTTGLIPINNQTELMPDTNLLQDAWYQCIQ